MAPVSDSLQYAAVASLFILASALLFSFCMLQLNIVLPNNRKSVNDYSFLQSHIRFLKYLIEADFDSSFIPEIPRFRTHFSAIFL